MKKVACAVLIFTMIIFLINPLSSDAGGYYGGGGYRGGGHYGGGYSVYRGGGHGGGYGLWWAPLAIVGGAVALVANSVAIVANSAAPAPNYNSPYYAPTYSAPPAYVRPYPSLPPGSYVYVYPR